MGIVSSEIVSNRPYGEDGHRKIREEHTDHLGNPPYPIKYIASPGYDVNARLAEDALLVDQNLKDQEIARGILEYMNGGDPLHFEESPNNWQPITPDFQTWDELGAAVTIDFLSRKNRNELAYIETIINRISGQTKASWWTMSIPEVSSVNGEIQNAVNAVAELEAYSPFFIDGVKQ